jgi:hypothetical protein
MTLQAARTSPFSFDSFSLYNDGSAEKDIVTDQKLKDMHFRQAAQHINDAQRVDTEGLVNNDLLLLSRGS